MSRNRCRYCASLRGQIWFFAWVPRVIQIASVFQMPVSSVFARFPGPGVAFIAGSTSLVVSMLIAQASTQLLPRYLLRLGVSATGRYRCLSDGHGRACFRRRSGKIFQKWAA